MSDPKTGDPKTGMSDPKTAGFLAAEDLLRLRLVTMELELCKEHLLRMSFEATVTEGERAAKAGELVAMTEGLKTIFGARSFNLQTGEVVR